MDILKKNVLKDQAKDTCAVLRELPRIILEKKKKSTEAKESTLLCVFEKRARDMTKKRLRRQCFPRLLHGVKKTLRQKWASLASVRGRAVFLWGNPGVMVPRRVL